MKNDEHMLIIFHFYQSTITPLLRNSDNEYPVWRLK